MKLRSILTMTQSNINKSTKIPKLKKAKYRPVLTAEQITYIITLAKREVPMSDLSFSVIASLAPFAAKIEAEALSPAYITAPPPTSLLEKLGGEFCKDENVGVPELPALLTKTKEERWASSYALYQIYPEKCTIEEIEDAHEHMYLNDLMTPEQVAAFEAKMLGDL